MIIKILSERLYFNKEILIHDKKRMQYVFRGLIFLAFLICMIYPLALLVAGVMTSAPLDILTSVLPVFCCLACDYCIRLKKNDGAWLLAFVILPLVIVLKFNYRVTIGLEFFGIPLAIACFFVVRKRPQVIIGFIFTMASFIAMHIQYNYHVNENFSHDLPFLILSHVLFAFTLFFLLLYLRNLLNNYHLERTKSQQAVADANEVLSDQNRQIRDQLDLLSKKNRIIAGAAVFHRKITSLLSHDLQSAIAPVRFLINMYEQGLVGKEEFGDYILKLENEVVHIENMLAEILTLSVQPEQRNEDRKSLVRLKTLIDEVCSEFRIMCDRKQLRIQNNVSEGLDLTTNGGLLKIIMRNLLSNAVKFSHSRSVIEVFDITKKNGYVTICVKDEGIGISEEDVARILSGQIVQQTGTMNEKGAGLGLGFCKDFISQLDGELEIHSKPEQGSVFSFTIPL